MQFKNQPHALQAHLVDTITVDLAKEGQDSRFLARARWSMEKQVGKITRARLHQITPILSTDQDRKTCVHYKDAMASWRQHRTKLLSCCPCLG